MDKGDLNLNVPTYNGGLFNTSPDKSDQRDQRIARFLLEHKVPDRHLALAIDRLARDQDERTLALVFIDYKSLVEPLLAEPPFGRSAGMYGSPGRRNHEGRMLAWRHRPHRTLG